MSDEHMILTPENASFSGSDRGTLCLALGDAELVDGLVIRQMFPVSRPRLFLSVRDREDKELGVIEDLDTFPKETRSLILQHAQHRYFVPRIEAIREIKDEHGYFMWDAMTDRGRREFYVKGRTDTLRVLGGCRIFVTDVEDCKYEIPDYLKLPRPSRAQLEKVL